MFKKMKNSYIYMNLILSDLPLIENPPPPPLVNDTWYLCWPPPNYSDLPRPFWIRTSPPSSAPLVWNCEEYAFQNRGVHCNYLVREGETKRKVTYLVWCARVAVCLLVASVRFFLIVCSCFWWFVVVYSCLYVFCGHLWSFAGGLGSFVVACDGLWTLSVLVTTNN